MNKKRIIGLTAVALLTGSFLVGCEIGGDGSESTKKESIKKDSLEELGYSIKSVVSHGDGINLVYLEKEKEKKPYIGIVDDDFKWVMEPNDKFQNLEFHEGLAAFAIPETREMILAKNPKAVVWGFLDSSGKAVIKPAYRSVNQFSNGVAIVETIEEDRDDLANSRTIVIDKSGKEIGEIQSSHLHTKEIEKEKAVETYLGGYAYAEDGFYDKKGTFTEMELKQSEYIAINEKRFENDGTENLEVFAKNLNGEVLNKFASNGESLYIYDFEGAEPNTVDQLVKNNVILVESDENSYLLDASSMSTLLRGDIQTGLGKGLLFVEDVTTGSKEDSDIEFKSGTFFDFNGKKVATVKDMVGPLLEDRYFVQGNEYFTLVDVDGNVLIDEDKKITDIEVLHYDSKKTDTNIFKSVIRVQYREDAKDIEPNEAFLNVETLKMIEPDELLKHQVPVD